MTNAVVVGNTNNPEEIGVLGDSEQFEGVRGVSHATSHGGVVGFNENQGDNPGPGVYGGSRGKGVYGNSDQGSGVYGSSSVGTGVHGETDKGTGVLGESRDWRGVQGKSVKDAGIYGESDEAYAVRGVSHASYHAGVSGINDNITPTAGPGVYGESQVNGVYGLSTSNNGAGVVGTNDNNDGVRGFSKARDHAGVAGLNTGEGGFGVYGSCDQGTGIVGLSKTWHGVYGETNSTKGGVGVFGRSEVGEGVRGETNSTVVAAVVGYSQNPSRDPEGVSCGVFGRSEAGEGVHGETNSSVFAAMAGIQLNVNSTGAGIYGEHRGRGPAGFFKGDVLVTGDIQLLNADFAEDFTILDVATAEPGTVMVINEDGALQSSERAYDRRVAGVISGAGDYKPAIVLDKQQSANNRLPIALVGKVYCKVDASYAPVEVGDLLTTSPTPGHAMKAADPLKAFGAVIGKALRPLPEGQGLIPILIALQ